MYFIFGCAVRLRRKQAGGVGAGWGACGGWGSGQTIGGGMVKVAVRPLVEGLASKRLTQNS
jgi:hypothetical protein